MTQKELIKEAIYFELYDKTKAVELISILNDIITSTSIDIQSYRLKNGNTDKLKEPMDRVEKLKQVRDGISSYYTDYESLRLEERKLHREVLKLRQKNDQLTKELTNVKLSFEAL